MPARVRWRPRPPEPLCCVSWILLGCVPATLTVSRCIGVGVVTPIICGLGGDRLGQRILELRTCLDPELSVGPAEMCLDGLRRDPELLGDLAVGPPGYRDPNHAQLARSERVAPGHPVAPRARPRERQLRAGLAGERRGTADDGGVEPFGEACAGRLAPPGSSLGGAEVHERTRVLESGRG